MTIKTNACQGCAKRTTEPNCHHPDRCEFWKQHMEEQNARYAERKANAQLARPPWKYDKHGNGRSSMYYSGNKENLCRTRRGCTTVRGGGEG